MSSTATNMGHFRSGQQRADRAELSGVVRRAHEWVARVLEQPDLRSGDLRLARRRSAQGVPARERPASSTPASAQSTRARGRRHAWRHAVAVGERQHRGDRASCGRRCRAAATRITRRSRASSARTTPSNVTRELWNSQQNADAETRSATSRSSARRRWRTDKVFVATLSNKLVVYGLIGPSGWQRRAGRQRRRDQNLPAPGTTTLTGTGNRRRQPGAAGAAHDDVEPGERAGGRDVQRAERALDRRDLLGAWRLHDPPQRVRWRRPRRATT